MNPRMVVVYRDSEYTQLLNTHGTHGAAAFFLKSRDQDIETVQRRHHLQERALEAVSGLTPRSWRRSRVRRAELDRFLFEPDDVIVAVGQDGLVANTAKYLEAQPVIGVNPDPTRFDGVLVRHSVDGFGHALEQASMGRVQQRTMVEASTDDGQRLLALNEIFLGQRNHQSARYQVCWGECTELQSSSGLIVATGTGSTGWARSIHLSRGSGLDLPAPDAPELVFFVREAFPSRATGTSVVEGSIADGDALTVTSRMDGGVLFGDGLEGDCINLRWSQEVTIRRAARSLHLV